MERKRVRIHRRARNENLLLLFLLLLFLPAFLSCRRIQNRLHFFVGESNRAFQRGARNRIVHNASILSELHGDRQGSRQRSFLCRHRCIQRHRIKPIIGSRVQELGCAEGASRGDFPGKQRINYGEQRKSGETFVGVVIRNRSERSVEVEIGSEGNKRCGVGDMHRHFGGRKNADAVINLRRLDI